MYRYILVVVFTVICNILSAQAYRTQAISPEVYTLQVNLNGDWPQSPIMKFNSGDNVHISFDRISDDSFNRLRYRIYHCDAYWRKSTTISDIDYLNGFNDNRIEEYSPSINTTVEYTHFNLTLPNRDVSFKLSGNYVVEVYEEDVPDQVLLTACFSICDPQLSITSEVSSNTDVDTNRAHQQLSFILHHQGFNIRDAHVDLMVFAQQNNRIDNERRNLKPTYVNPGKLIYEHNKDLIFEAGNEYRRFETSSYRYNGMNIEHIEYNRPNYTMFVETDKMRIDKGYSYDQDQNGRYVVRTNEGEKNETEADYFITNFTLVSDSPLREDVFINGAFTNNTFSDRYKMQYDNDDGVYRASILLKQGMYNYLYLTEKERNFSTAKVEGNYYEAENEYSIYVYYRPTGQRYDSLIGTQTIKSREK